MKPDELCKNHEIPVAIWLHIYSFIELPLAFVINQRIATLFRYRPISIAWTQVPRVDQRFVGISRDTLYFCDAHNMIVFEDELGRECFGVKPRNLFRSTPLLRIDLDDRMIVGFMIHTAALPLENIPKRFREKINTKDPATWYYETDSPLLMYCYGVWKMVMKEREFASFEEYYTTITHNQYVCIHEITPSLNMSGGTYFDDDDSGDSDPLAYLREKMLSESPHYHLAPFKDANGEIMTTEIFYPSLDLNFIEFGVTITNQSSPDIVRSNCVAPDNVLHELDRISDYWNTPMCPRCNIPRMCTITCCGPKQEIKTVMKIILDKLNKTIPIRLNQSVTKKGLNDFRDLLLQWNERFEILVTQFIDEFYMFFSFEDKHKPEIASDDFPITTDFQRLNEIEIPSFKGTNKRKKHIVSRRISSRMVSLKFKNGHSSSDSEDDDLIIKNKFLSPIKRQKLNDGSGSTSINVHDELKLDTR